MQIIYHFRQEPTAFIERSLTDPEVFFQVGGGLILWSETGNKKPRLFRDGAELDAEGTLNGCRLDTNCGFAFRISGADYNGERWSIILGDGLSYRKILISKNEMYVRREHIMDLFDGQPFQKVISQCCCQFVRKQKLGALQKEKNFAKHARKTMEEALFLITKEKGNHQARVKVCTMIKKLLASH